MRSKMVSLVLACVLAAGAASAGTVYLNFDDGGATLPDGITTGTGGWGDPAYADGALVLSGGGPYMNFPSTWISGQSVTMEFTIPDLLAGIPAERGGTGWQEGTFNAGWKAGGTLCKMGGGILGGPNGSYNGITTTHLGMVDWSNTYAGNDFDIEGACALTTGFRVTIKVVVDADADTWTTYYAYGDNATTPTQRATNWTLLYQFTAVDLTGDDLSWGIQSWGALLRVDDVIIEGDAVPNFGTAPGFGQVTVTDLSGMTEEAAVAAATDAGLTIGNITYEHSDTVPSGQLISQSLDAGSSVDSGSTIDLVISLGSASDVPALCVPFFQD